MGFLVCPSAVMGAAANVQLFPEYQEPVNLYALCVGPSVHQPIIEIVAGWDENVIVDDFTLYDFCKLINKDAPDSPPVTFT